MRWPDQCKKPEITEGIAECAGYAGQPREPFQKPFPQGPFHPGEQKHADQAQAHNDHTRHFHKGRRPCMRQSLPDEGPSYKNQGPRHRFERFHGPAMVPGGHAVGEHQVKHPSKMDNCIMRLKSIMSMILSRAGMLSLLGGDTESNFPL